MNETQLRAGMVTLAGRMFSQGFIHGRAGNLSARLPHGAILATPAGLNKAEMYPDQLVVVDLDGKVLEGAPGLRPTSELAMHLEVYRQRPDVGAVLHAHPINGIVLTLLGISMEDPYIPEALVLLGPVPTTPYATPSSLENRDAISEVIQTHDAILLAHHGSLTVGADLEQAYERLETLENTAEILVKAFQIGQPRQLSPGAVEKLYAMRARHREARVDALEEDEVAARIAQEVQRLLDEGSF